MDYIAFVNVSLTPKRNNFIGQIGADLLIRNGKVPSNTAILHEIIYRAMLIKGNDVPEH